MDDTCQNCRSPDATIRSLTAANDPASVVFLCDACHGSLEEQFVWGNAAAN